MVLLQYQTDSTYIYTTFARAKPPRGMWESYKSLVHLGVSPIMAVEGASRRPVSHETSHITASDQWRTGDQSKLILSFELRLLQCNEPAQSICRIL